MSLPEKKLQVVRGRKSGKWQKTIGWLIPLAIFVILRIPSLFEPFAYGDEGIYLALGQAMRRGWVFYRDIHDNKPPLIYLMAALAGSFKLYRGIYFLWSIGSFGVFYLLAKKLLRQPKARIISLTAWAILSAIPLFEGNIANAENFIALTSLGGFYLLVKKRKKAADYFTAGLLFGLSFLFKVPAFFDFLAAGVVFFLIKPKKIKEILAQIKQKKIWLIIGGWLTPLAISLVYYFSQKAGQQYLTAALAQNIPYLSSWGQATEGKKVLTLPWGLMGRAIVAGGITFWMFVRRQRKDWGKATKICLAWFVWATFGALLSSRPYPHYLFQALPALCLSFGLIAEKEIRWKLLPLIFGLVILAINLHFNYFYYPTKSYYQNFWNYLTGEKSREEYFSFWGNQVNDLYRTAAYLKARTTPAEKIFIWSDQPSLYPLSERLPVGRYTTAYHLKDFDKGLKQTLPQLEKEPPRFLVIFRPDQNGLQPLAGWLGRLYLPTVDFGQFTIYRRL